jgi:hypothetical protein
LLLLLLVVVVIVAAAEVGAEDGLDERLMAPAEALTSEAPSTQSMLESS